MEIIILILAVFGVIFYFISESTKKEIASRPKDFIMESNGVYIVGLPNKLSGKEFYINIFEKYVELFFIDGRARHKIPLKDIQNVAITSESSVRERVTAGRLLVFGVFALGMKKKKEEYKNMLEMTHMYQGELVTSIYTIRTEADLIKIVNHLRTEIQKRKEQDVV